MAFAVSRGRTSHVAGSTRPSWARGEVGFRLRLPETLALPDPSLLIDLGRFQFPGFFLQVTS